MNFGGIQKIIHQIWINDTHINKNNKKDVPEKWKKSILRWKELHPTWKHVLWTDEDIINFLKQDFPNFLDTYYNYPYLIQRADMVRYLILYRFGGVYCDLDLFPEKNIEPFLKYNVDNYFVLSAGSETITNALMVCSKGSELMRTIINNLKNPNIPWFAYGKHLYVMFTTGPNFLNNIVVNSDQPYLILPRSMFYPYSESEDKFITEDKDKIVINAIQGTSGSWHEFDSLIYSFVNTRRSIFVFLGIFFIVLMILALIYYIFKYRKTQKYCSDVKEHCDSICGSKTGNI